MDNTMSLPAVKVLEVLAERGREFTGLLPRDEEAGWKELIGRGLVREVPNAKDGEETYPLTVKGLAEIHERWPEDPARVLEDDQASGNRLRVALFVALTELGRLKSGL